MADRAHCDEREKISAWISLGLDGRLTPEQQADLESHLVACPTCRAQQIAMHRISSLLAASPMVGPPYGFSLRVERRLAERATQRRQALRGVALLTGSLSLVGVGASVILVIGLALVALLWFGSQPAWQQASLSIPQVASGLGLMGKGASLFLKDVLLRYGLPVVLLVGGGVALVGGVWVWLFSRRSKISHPDGYA